YPAVQHRSSHAIQKFPIRFYRSGRVLDNWCRPGHLATMTSLPIDRAAIAMTERLIRPHIRHTPIIRIDAGDLGIAGEPRALKLEFLQHTGSFKPRGAFANLLTRNAPEAGAVAASGGNHGAAVAYAAMRLGIKATIFVPTVASPTKIERIRGYGAELIVGGERYADALAASEEFAARKGALVVHAYDQPETLLGQGSVGLEIEADMPEIDTLFVAVGGGGLIGGIGAWLEGRVRWSGSSRNWRRPCMTRWPLAARSMRRPAASPRMPWRRAGSAR